MIQEKKKSVCISHVRTSDSSFSDNVVANLQKQIDANKTAIENDVVKKVSKDAVGHIINQASPTPPDSRYLECDGSVINSTSYPELWAMTEEDVNFKSLKYEKDIIGAEVTALYGNVGRFFEFDGKICKFVDSKTLAYSSDGINWSKKVFSSLTINDECTVQVFEGELVVLLPAKNGFKIWRWPSFSGSASTITVRIDDYGSSATATPSGIGYINGKYIVITTQTGYNSIITRVAKTDDWRTSSGWSAQAVSGYPNLGSNYAYGPILINNTLYFITITSSDSKFRVYLIYTSDGTTFSYKLLTRSNIPSSYGLDKCYEIDYYDNNNIYLSYRGVCTLRIRISDSTVKLIGDYGFYIHSLQIGMAVNVQKNVFSEKYPLEIIDVSIEDESIGYRDNAWHISEDPNGEYRMSYIGSTLYIYVRRSTQNSGLSYNEGLVQAFDVGKFVPYISSPSHHFIKAKEDF